MTADRASRRNPFITKPGRTAPSRAGTGCGIDRVSDPAIDCQAGSIAAQPSGPQAAEEGGNGTCF